MELVNLYDLKQALEEKYHLEFVPEERVLPKEFKDRVRTINNNVITYQNYTMVIESQKVDLYSYIPNQWFYIAAFFCDYYAQLQLYREKVFELIDDKDKIKKCYNNESYTRQLLDSVTYYDVVDKEWLIKFLFDYSWWGGAKTIDRNDFYVSPILSMANVVNASQSFIAEICKFLAQNKEELIILQNEIGNIAKNESIIERRILINSNYRSYVTAIKSKPFILLAGISGTGKSRIVRELARACYSKDSEEYKAHKPANFEMIQVRPNWHDSTELLGYVSHLNGEKYIAGDFLKFIVKAWVNENVPHFLCLDEMNLAPVEQYFAEYLSVIETREKVYDARIITDPILKPCIVKQIDDEEQNGANGTNKDWYRNLISCLLKEANCPDEKLYALTKQFEDYGISIPQNLIVMGTVNMDETTFSFSRKVLDRAMSIEMNEIKLDSGLETVDAGIGKLNASDLIGVAVHGEDVYSANRDVCQKVLHYLEKLNEKLEGTPFKVAYRTRNEFLLYVVNNLDYVEEGGSQNDMIATALDEITAMKVLSRIEGDDTKISKTLLPDLMNMVKNQLNEISGKEYVEKRGVENEDVVLSVSLKKLEEMNRKLKDTGYTSYWS